MVLSLFCDNFFKTHSKHVAQLVSTLSRFLYFHIGGQSGFGGYRRGALYTIKDKVVKYVLQLQCKRKHHLNADLVLSAVTRKMVLIRVKLNA